MAHSLQMGRRAQNGRTAWLNPIVSSEAAAAPVGKQLKPLDLLPLFLGEVALLEPQVILASCLQFAPAGADARGQSCRNHGGCRGAVLLSLPGARGPVCVRTLSVGG